MLTLEGGPGMASHPVLAAAERADAIAMPIRQNDFGELVAKNLALAIRRHDESKSVR